MHNVGDLKNIDANNIDLIIVDLFAGAGGTTTGYANSKRNGKHNCIVAAAINHDPVAIKSHWENHPEVQHYEEDITTFYGSIKHGVFLKSDQMLRLQRLVQVYRAFYPKAKLVLWASLECTNFSNAKGGMSRDADSRTLGQHLQFYVDAINPDYIKIENVVEFMSWGPLRIKGKRTKVDGYWCCELRVSTKKEHENTRDWYCWTPIEKQKGRDFIAWKQHLESYGYRSDQKQLDSADYGAYTKRNRFFMIFAKDNLPITWPEPTHAKKISDQALDLFASQLKPHKAVREVLDLEDEGQSIFNRKKPYSDNTLRRIYHGLIKFVAKENVRQFLQMYYSSDKPESMLRRLDVPGPTITTTDVCSLVTVKQAEFVSYYNSYDSKTKTHRGFSDLSDPLKTLTTFGTPKYVIVKKAAFISNFYGSGDNTHSIDKPACTIIGADVHSLVQARWIDRHFTSGDNSHSIEQPIGSLPTVPKASIVQAKHYFIMNPSHVVGHNTGIDSPCPVVIARQDKSPLYLVAAKDADFPVAVPVYEDDSEIMIRIKEFMALHGLSDVMNRMLKIIEIKPIQGFPVDYKLCGTQSQQKKQLGNVVHTVICEAMGAALGESLSKLSK